MWRRPSTAVPGSSLRRRGAHPGLFAQARCPRAPPGVTARCAGAARRGGWWDGAAEGGHVGGQGIVEAPALQAPGADEGGELGPRAGWEKMVPAGRGGADARSPRPIWTGRGGSAGWSAGDPPGRGRGRAPSEGLKPARLYYGEGHDPADLPGIPLRVKVARSPPRRVNAGRKRVCPRSRRRVAACGCSGTRNPKPPVDLGPRRDRGRRRRLAANSAYRLRDCLL